MFCIRLTKTSYHLHVVALLLVLIASIVIIYKWLWIKASDVNVNKIILICLPFWELDTLSHCLL